MNNKKDSAHYYEQSQRFHNSNQHKESILSSKRALTARSSHYDAQFQWGRNLIDQEDYEKAIRKHREIIIRDPEDYKAYYNLGVAFERDLKFLDAEIQYKKSISINSYFQDPGHNLAIVLTYQCKYREALEQYEKNIACNPDDSSTISCYGYLKFILGDYEDAIKSFENAIEKDDEYSFPYTNKSIALFCLGQTDLAGEVFQEVVKKVKAYVWKQRFEKKLRIYRGELKRFEEILKNGDLGEINREKLIINIESLHFMVDLISKELIKNASQKVDSLDSMEESIV